MLDLIFAKVYVANGFQGVDHLVIYKQCLFIVEAVGYESHTVGYA